MLADAADAAVKIERIHHGRWGRLSHYALDPFPLNPSPGSARRATTPFLAAQACATTVGYKCVLLTIGESDGGGVQVLRLQVGADDDVDVPTFADIHTAVIRVSL